MIIRSVTVDDAEELLGIYSYYVEDTAISFEYTTPSVEEFRGRIETILKNYPYIVIEDEGKITGYAYAGVFHGREAYKYSCEMSIYVDRNARKRGYGRALYEAIEEELRARGMKNLYACIAVPEGEDEYLDRNSEDFHEHMGYELIGEFHKCGYKFNRWYNIIYMEKLL